MARITGLIIACGLIALLVSALGCTREVEVVREVEVTRDVEVMRDVQVVVTATPGPDSGQPAAPAQPTAAPAPRPTASSPAAEQDIEYVYQLGISADLTTTN